MKKLKIAILIALILVSYACCYHIQRWNPMGVNLWYGILASITGFLALLGLVDVWWKVWRKM